MEQFAFVGFFVDTAATAARSAATLVLAPVVSFNDSCCTLHRTEDDKRILNFIFIVLHQLSVQLGFLEDLVLLL